MARLVYKNADKTVATIAARDALARKVDGMIVVVEDAIADPNTSGGQATYRYIAANTSWVLLSKVKYESISFQTEELTIVNGAVVPANVPTDNQIWGVRITDGNTIIAEPRDADYIVDPSGISGLGAWEGKKILFTYAHGSISAQVDTYIDYKFEQEYGSTTEFNTSLDSSLA